MLPEILTLAFSFGFLFLVFFFLLIAPLFYKKRKLIFFLIFSLFQFEHVGSVTFSGVTIRISQVLLLFLFSFLIFEVFFKGKFSYFAKKVPFESFLILPYLSYALISVSFSESLGRSLQVFFFTAFTFLLLFVVPYFFEEKDLFLIKKILVFVTIFVSFFSFYQFVFDLLGFPKFLTGLQERYTKIVFGFPRPHSTLLEPLFFANFLVFLLSFLLSEILEKSEGDKKFFFLEVFAFLVGVAALILTLSRGGIVSFLISVFLVFLFNFKKVFRKEVLHVFLGFLSFWFLFFGVFLLVFGEKFSTFFSHATNFFYGVSLEERNLSQRIALEAFLENPIFGTGIGSFGSIYKRKVLLAKDSFQVVNNQYLEILTETGILGFFLFFLFLSVFMGRLFRKILDEKDALKRNFLIAVFAGMIGTFFQWTSFSTLYTFWVWLWVSFSLSL